MDESTVDKESVAGLSWASSVFKVRLEISRKGAVSGGLFQSTGGSETVFETATVARLALGLTAAWVKMVDRRAVGSWDLPGARAGAEVAISGSEVTEGIPRALAVGGDAGFGAAEVIRREATVPVVGSVVTCLGSRGDIFCSEKNCEL